MTRCINLKLTALVFTAASKAKNWASTTALPLPHEHTSRYYPGNVSKAVRHALMLWFGSSAARSILFKQWLNSCRVGTEIEYKHQIKGLPVQLHFSWWPYLPNTSGAACSLEYIGFAVPCEYPFSPILVQLWIHCTIVTYGNLPWKQIWFYLIHLCWWYLFFFQ